MYHCRKSLLHILGWSKLLHVIKPSPNLIAHGACYVVAWYLVLVIDKGFTPYLSIDFVLSGQMITDIILFLSNLIKLLLSVNVHSSYCLAQTSSTLVLAELISHSFLSIEL